MVRRLQLVAAGATALFVLLGLGASTHITPLVQPPSVLLALLYPLLAAVGAACGLATVLRHRQIDAKRWEIVQQDGLTSGERQTAHREADREIRFAAATFFLAGVSCGGWLSYQFRDLDRFTASDLLILAPVVGFGVALWIGGRRFPATGPTD